MTEEMKMENVIDIEEYKEKKDKLAHLQIRIKKIQEEMNPLVEEIGEMEMKVLEIVGPEDTLIVDPFEFKAKEGRRYFSPATGFEDELEKELGPRTASTLTVTSTTTKPKTLKFVLEYLDGQGYDVLHPTRERILNLLGYKEGQRTLKVTLLEDVN